MEIDNHLLTGDQVVQQSTPNTSGKYTAGLPDTLVIHFTGGRSATSSANWLCNPKAKASAHVVIGQQGEIIQLAPFDTITWHAGKSHWEERSGLNKYSIGIEIDNAGRLEKRENGYYTWFGTEVPAHRVVPATHRNETVPTYWHAYTESQISTVEQLCSLLIDTYGIRLILGHEEISPGRKVDPGPAFPLDKLRNTLLYNNRESEDASSFQSEGETKTKMAYVTASLLNIRSLPTSSANKVAEPLKKGTLLKVIDQKGGWSKVVVETEGWVSSEWLKN